MQPYIKKIYVTFFWPLYSTNQIQVNIKLFSDFHVLDVLGCEKKSFDQIAIFLKKEERKLGTKFNKVLVVGTGSGALASQLEFFLNPTELLEIDINPDVIKRRMQMNKTHPRRKAELENVEDMPYENETFDLVVAYGVIRYVTNLEKAVKEMFRVLSPTGLALLGEGRKESIIDQVEKLLPEKILQRRITLKDISLPNLTFAYTLIDLYESQQDHVLNELVELELKTSNRSVYEVLFHLAGYKKGDIFLLTAQKYHG